MTMTCFHCLKPLSLICGEKIFRNTECPHCSNGLRVCKMCTHYDPHSYNECREPNAERIMDKEKANFCDYFHLDDNKSQKDNSQDLQNAANMIFKEKK